MVISERRNGISPKTDCSHGMKKLGAFITKFNSIYSIPFLPIDFLVPEKSTKVLLDYHSEIPFCISQASTVFQTIHVKDNFIAILYE
jgi:hypothetical protein